MKKLSKTKNLHEIARDLRKEKSIEELVKVNEITYIPFTSRRNRTLEKYK